MIRLQRVTFLALHDYLGLTTELTRPTDNTVQAQITSRPQNNQHHHRHTHATAMTSQIPTTSSDVLNTTEDDFFDSQNPRISRSISTIADNSPSSDQTPMPTPEISNNKNQFENIQPPPISERTISNPMPIPKRSSIYAGQRSMSVIESRHLKPDFEEAAARARVKNSLDTTFFQKHKISYPNMSNNRLTNLAAARRRASFSDVKHFFPFSNFSINIFLSRKMQMLIQDQ
jgi:hypothetical protein